MKFNKLLCSVFLMAFCLIGSQASADPIQNWTFNLEYGFSAYTETEGGWNGVVESVNNISGQPTVLTWGHSINTSEQSSIGVAPGNSTGPYVLGSGFQSAMTFTHQNNPIDARYDTLETATLQSTFQLFPTGFLSEAKTVDFEIEFWETPNEDYPTDIFWLKNPENLISKVVIGDYEYTIEFTITGLMDPLPDWARGHFGVGDKDEFIGLSTLEGQPNDFETQFRITARAIPEPGTFFLFGFGMIGMAGAIRRKVNRS